MSGTVIDSLAGRSIPVPKSPIALISKFNWGISPTAQDKLYLVKIPELKAKYLFL